MAEEKKQEEAKKEQESQVPDLVQVLSKYPGAPTQDDVEGWKQQFGELFCSGFSETELFVWRCITRREYVNLQKALRAPPTEPNQEPPTEYDFEESVVKTCVVWSSVPDVTKKGGTVSTLSEQIMMHSNFMNQAMAAALVVKL
jgi:hypothetical protein